MPDFERSRLFVRDTECEPGYEVDIFEPGEDVTIEPGTWEEFVPVSELQGAVEAERGALRMILKADQGDWDRTVPTLAQWAEARLRELGGQSESAPAVDEILAPEEGT